MIQIGNAKLTVDILSSKYSNLLNHLKWDVNQDDSNPELVHEALELLLNIVSIKEL